MYIYVCECVSESEMCWSWIIHPWNLSSDFEHMYICMYLTILYSTLLLHRPELQIPFFLFCSTQTHTQGHCFAWGGGRGGNFICTVCISISSLCYAIYIYTTLIQLDYIYITLKSGMYRIKGRDLRLPPPLPLTLLFPAALHIYIYLWVLRPASTYGRR